MSERYPDTERYRSVCRRVPYLAAIFATALAVLLWEGMLLGLPDWVVVAIWIPTTFAIGLWVAGELERQARGPA